MWYPSQELVWSEGTFLGQQHFQQWSKNLSAKEKFWFHFNQGSTRYGFLSLSLDTSELESGVLGIRSCQAVLPSGQVFSFDASRCNKKLSYVFDLHKSASHPSIPEDTDWLTVYLGFPEGECVSGVSGYPDHDKRQSTWLGEYVSCPDEMDRERTQEILFGSLNLRIYLNPGEKNALPVAQVRSVGEGRYVLNEEFIPPMTCLQASERLMSRLRNFKTYLSLRRQDIVGRLNKGGLSVKSNYGLHSGWLLRALLEKILLFEYKIQTWLHDRSIDPRAVYDQLTQLNAGVLSLSPMRIDEQVLDVYDPDKVSFAFESVFHRIKQAMQWVMPKNQQVVALNQESECLYTTDALSEKIFESSHLYLEVFFENLEEGWQTRFVKEAKLAAVEDIHSVVAQALPGIQLTHCRERPENLLCEQPSSYFRIEKNEQMFWKNALRTKRVGIFLPKFFMDAKLSLVALFSEE